MNKDFWKNNCASAQKQKIWLFKLSEEENEVLSRKHRKVDFGHIHVVWKLFKMSHLNFSMLAFSTSFYPIKSDLSGNSIWPQTFFWHFQSTFVHSKCKRSSLRSQWWMRLFYVILNHRDYILSFYFQPWEVTANLPPFVNTTTPRVDGVGS